MLVLVSGVVSSLRTKYGWFGISMKKDWKRVFAFEN